MGTGVCVPALPFPIQLPANSPWESSPGWPGAEVQPQGALKKPVAPGFSQARLAAVGDWEVNQQLRDTFLCLLLSLYPFQYTLKNIHIISTF